MTALTEIETVDDVELGVWLLRGVPTNQHRADAVLAQVSERAQRFGASLAAAPSPPADLAQPARLADPAQLHVVERHDGLDGPAPVLARYLHRSGTVELYVDSIAFCEDLIDRSGWRDRFPAGTVRAAALLHEQAHHLIAGPHAAALRAAVGVPALRIGRFVRWAHVAGAEELAAHAFAQQALDLPRSPLLITAVAAAALDSVGRP